MDQILETPRLIIRKCLIEDVDQLQTILGDLEVMRYSLKGPLDRDGIIELVKENLAHYKRHGYGIWCLILKKNNGLIGVAGLLDQIVEDEPYVELSYRLAKKYWGHGFATEAALSIKEYAFNVLNINRLISIIEPGNIASINVAKRIGMIKAKSATFHGLDVEIYDVQKIILFPFDPSWIDYFKAERERLKQLFGEVIFAIYHIGSTAIPGCFAKPIIDILAVSNNVLQIDQFNDALQEMGYIPLGEYGMKQRRFFRKRGHLSVNLHIFEDSDPEVARHLRFRDFLISHPEEIKRYSALKRELAAKNSSDIVPYILGKETFIKKIDYLAALDDTGKYWQKKILPRKEHWSDNEIVDAMEVNMHLHMTYFAKYLPNMKIEFQPDVTVVTSDIMDDTFNYVIGAKFKVKEAEDRIEEVVKLFKKKHLPFSWWVSEKDEPDSLHSLLEQHGLSVKEEDMGMSLSLDLFSSTRKLDNLAIKRALNQERLQEFSEVLISLGLYPQIYEELFSKIPPVLYQEGAPFELYVGYIEKKPVVTGILVLHANVGGIYYVMTHPEYRRRGYGKEMMIYLLLRAKERGYHMVTLQASASGKTLYQKLGFETKCRFVEYA